MPEAIKNQTVTHSLRFVRIPFGEFIKKLETFENDNYDIKATNGGNQFFNFEDIKEHPELFKGSPNIEIGNFDILFGGNLTRVLYSPPFIKKEGFDHEKNTNTAKNLTVFLSQYENRIVKFLYNYFTAINLCLTISMVGLSFLSDFNRSFMIILALVTGFYISALLVLQVDFKKRRNQA